MQASWTLALRWLIACLALGGAACTSQESAPDLERLYAMQSGKADQPPLVLVHGYMGARLVEPDTGREIWPGTGKVDYGGLALQIDPQTLKGHPGNLEPSGLAQGASSLALDGRILEVLEEAGRYVRAEAGEPSPPGNSHYYVFVYDWRRDNIDTVRQLDRFLAQIRADHDDPDLKVDIVAHGIGGLITRYYLRYGTLDTLDDNDFPVNSYGAQFVRRVVLVGVPNLGTVVTVRALTDGRPGAHSQQVRPEVLATMPSTFQVLPHPITTAMVDTAGEELDRDLFEARTWRDFQWSIYDPEVRRRIAGRFADPAEARRYLELLDRYFDKTIERARRFVWSLTVPADELPVRYIIIGGSCELTPKSVLVEEIDDRVLARLWPAEVVGRRDGVDYMRLLLEPGDGIVTKSSLLARHVLDPRVKRHKYSYFPMDYPLFLCERHDRLTANLSFHNNLLQTLLSVDPR